jgi:zinc D-Ala-D-Ala dipeptidase
MRRRRKVAIARQHRSHWRDLLAAALTRQGFVNYSKVWWHFSLPGAGREAYDFAIQPRCN